MGAPYGVNYKNIVCNKTVKLGDLSQYHNILETLYPSMFFLMNTDKLVWRRPRWRYGVSPASLLSLYRSLGHFFQSNFQRLTDRAEHSEELHNRTERGEGRGGRRYGGRPRGGPIPRPKKARSRRGARGRPTRFATHVALHSIPPSL